MVKQMNKKEYIEKLSKEISYTKEECIIISEILEENFFIRKKNKNKIIEELKNTLKIEEQEANRIYNISTKIIKEEIKNKLKHPFTNH